jgi:hypothetical protein
MGLVYHITILVHFTMLATFVGQKNRHLHNNGKRGSEVTTYAALRSCCRLRYVRIFPVIKEAVKNIPQ